MSQISEGTDGGMRHCKQTEWQQGQKYPKHREQTVIQFGWTMVYCRGWWCLGGKGKLRLNYEGFEYMVKDYKV